MSYLKFDKQDLINLELSLDKELLRTSRTGAYSCTTISSCNTRKYHGLFVCPVPELDNDPHVLLSSLDETVIQHEAEFNLGLHKFDHEHYSPKGHKYIREFECEVIPKLTYRVGGVILSKEKIFVSSGEDRIMIRYKLLEAHSDTIIRFKPLLAFRNYHRLSVANMDVNHNYNPIQNGIGIRMYHGYPELNMQFSKSVEFVPVPHWYYGIEYKKEQDRGYEFKEDLFSPGYFELDIKKGESIIFTAGLTPADMAGIKSRFNAEVKKRSPRNNFINCLKNSAQQFIVIKNDRADIKAGYPWLPKRGRDTFIALPGLSLSIGGTSAFKSTFKNVLSDLALYLDNGTYPPDIQDYDAPDVLLWATWSFQKLSEISDLQFKDFELLFGKILKHIIDGKVTRLQLHDNGLLSVDGTRLSASWMNASAYGKPSVYRNGYLVEINALWYNALSYYIHHCESGCKQKRLLTQTIAKIEQNFELTFGIPDKPWLYDFVEPGYSCKIIRPNMLFAASVPYSPLNRDRRKKILDTVEKYLLTPRGLRSLSPSEPDFVGDLFGDQQFRDRYYFNGSVWPWLIGSFTDAYLSIYKESGLHFISSVLSEFDEVMVHNCIGSISEYYNGNPPHEGHGAISSAINVAELLRTAMKLEKIELKNKAI